MDLEKGKLDQAKAEIDAAKLYIEQLRQQFPTGTRVELVRMEDAQAPPVGTQRTVLGVDDTGSLIMRWDNGSGLNVVYGEDVVRKISE